MTTQILRASLLLWLGSLFALMGTERLLIDPIAGVLANLAVLVFQLAPILVVAVVLIRDSARGAFWASLIALLYFTHGVAQTADASERLVGAIEIVVSLGVFVSAVLLLRAAPKRSQ